MTNDEDRAQPLAADHLADLVRIRRLAASGAAKTIRVSAGISLGEAAAPAGVTPTAVWRWENGERVPRGDAALRYLMVLDRLSGAMATRRGRRGAA